MWDCIDYNIEWPQKWAIYQARAIGKPVPIILWPARKLEA